MGTTSDFLTGDIFDFDDSKKFEAEIAAGKAKAGREAAASRAKRQRVTTKQTALKKTKTEAAARRGRRSTILTGGLEDQLGLVTRPEARGATLLGG